MKTYVVLVGEKPIIVTIRRPEALIDAMRHARRIRNARPIASAPAGKPAPKSTAPVAK